MNFQRYSMPLITKDKLQTDCQCTMELKLNINAVSKLMRKIVTTKASIMKAEKINHYSMKLRIAL